MIFILIAYVAHVLENTLIAYVVKDIGPFVCILCFYIVSTLCVFTYEKIVYLKKPKSSIDWALVRERKLPLLFYIFGAFFGNSLWFMSIFLIGIGTVSFILIFIRLFVAVYAYLFMDDRYPADKMIAFAAAFIALGFYSYSGLETNWLGISLALLSCFAFSTEAIAQKKLASSGLKVESIVLWRYAVLCVLFTLIFSALNGLDILTSDMTQLPSLETFGIICVASLLGSVGAGVAAMYGLKTVPLSIFESLNTTKPVLLSLIGISFLDESMTIAQMGWGVVIILSSLYFMKPNKKNKQEQVS